jgi:hypothetical protein
MTFAFANTNCYYIDIWKIRFHKKCMIYKMYWISQNYRSWSNRAVLYWISWSNRSWCNEAPALTAWISWDWNTSSTSALSVVQLSASWKHSILQHLLLFTSSLFLYYIPYGILYEVVHLSICSFFGRQLYLIMQ